MRSRFVTEPLAEPIERRAAETLDEYLDVERPGVPKPRVVEAYLDDASVPVQAIERGVSQDLPHLIACEGQL